MRPTFIFLHDCFAHRGKTEKSLLHAARLAGEFADVHLAVLWNHGTLDLDEEAIFKSIRQFEFPWSMKPGKQARHHEQMQELARAMDALKPDATIAFSLRSAIRAAEIVEETGRPHAWNCLQDFPLFSPPFSGRKTHTSLNSLGNANTRIVCETETKIDEFSQFDFPLHQLHLLRDGIDVARYSEARVSASGNGSRKRSLGLDETAFVLLCSADADPAENHSQVIEAVGELCRFGRDIQVVFVGDEAESQRPYRSALRQLAEDQGVANNVVFPGPTTDLRPWLQAADAFVAPCRLGNKLPILVQAGAAGLPLLAKRIGAHHEIVRHEETGFLFNGDDHAQLTRLIDDLMGDPILRERLGRAASALVEEEFNSVRQDEKWTRFLQELASLS